MRHISFDNFLIELSQIQIDELDLIIKDGDGNTILLQKVAELYKQIKNLQTFKEAVNLATFGKSNEVFTLSVGEMSYSFYGERFLRNITHVTIGELQTLTILNNLNFAQMLYLIVNIERVIFNN